jgi:endonuclease YncB( thermonuclease family)
MPRITCAMFRLVRRCRPSLLTLDLPRHVTESSRKAVFGGNVTILTSFVRATLLLTFVIVGSSTPVAAQNHVTGQVVGVEAGDTVRVRVDDWEVTVRLHGILTPTTPPELVERAREYTVRRVAETRVKIEVRGTGPKQTLYGEVQTADGASLNEEMIQVGLARWAQEYAPTRTRLGELETQAHEARRGMWSDPTGANVPLPPSLAERLRATPTPIGSASPTPTVPVPSPGATPDVAPTPASTSPALPAPASAPPRFNRPVLDVAFPALAFLTAFFFILLHWRSRWEVRCIPAQLLTALLFAAGGTMLVPLPILLLGGRFAVTNATVTVGIAAPLAALCLWAAFALTHREQILRGTPRCPIATIEEGLIRIAGEASAPGGTVESIIGRIPGIYIREVTWRYEADPERAPHGRGRKRVTPHRWVKQMDETRTADFRLTDESGAIIVDGDRATFHPLRVARFYNDIPVEEFFDRPYTGDTRTEVFFIPAKANLTVWGRAYRTASPVPNGSEIRIGGDPATVGLIVVEENAARVYSGRASVGLMLTLAAIGLAAVAAYGILAPDPFAGLLGGTAQ